MLEFSLTMEVLSECLDQRINNNKKNFMSKTHGSLLYFNNNLTLIYCDKNSI